RARRGHRGSRPAAADARTAPAARSPARRRARDLRRGAVMTLTVLTDRSLVRAAGGSVRHVLVSFTAPEPARAASRPPVNVSLVIDRSGSVGGQKIDLARQAVVQALRTLRSTDRFSVVSYDHEI